MDRPNSFPAVLDLADGRSLSVAPDTRSLELRSPTGLVEVRIELRADGPSVQVAATRLSLVATESVAVDAPNIRLRARNKLELLADEDIIVRGNPIRLN